MLKAHLDLLRRAIDVARQARAHGNHPFGAILVDAHGSILLEAENSVVTDRDCTGHAELNLIRKASQQFDRSVLAECTLYTSTEPCAMCAGSIFWGGVSRLVYGLSEVGLLEIVGDSAPDSFLSLPCREVFAHGLRSIEVIGPLLEDEARQVHAGFWR
jgi:tRNA(Arg) A34 adenosine deaminase TadA